MKKTFKLEGFRELERALAEDLPRTTAKGVLTRAGKKAMKPLEDRMVALAPVDEGEYRDSFTTKKVKAKRGAGGRYARSTGVEIASGPTGKQSGGVGSWQERGTVNMPANPHLRPAADEKGPDVIKHVRDTLATEIRKSAERIARKAARKG